MEDVWGEYEKEELQEIEGSNRGNISSELYVTGTELDEIEQILGNTVDDAFDEFQETEFESSKYQTVAAANNKGNTVILEGPRDIPTQTLIHESVHGLMLQPNGRNNLPGNNEFEQTIYDEFVARLAEDEIKELQVPKESLEELRKAHDDYMLVREQYTEEVVSENFESLYQDIKHTDQTTDKKAQYDIDQVWQPYQSLREQVLAAEAAKRYKEEKENIDISEFIKPDEKLYTDTVEYIKQVENDVLRREN